MSLCGGGYVYSLFGLNSGPLILDQSAWPIECDQQSIERCRTAEDWRNVVVLGGKNSGWKALQQDREGVWFGSPCAGRSAQQDPRPVDEDKPAWTHRDRSS